MILQAQEACAWAASLHMLDYAETRSQAHIASADAQCNLSAYGHTLRQEVFVIFFYSMLVESCWEVYALSSSSLCSSSCVFARAWASACQPSIAPLPAAQFELPSRAGLQRCIFSTVSCHFENSSASQLQYACPWSTMCDNFASCSCPV